MCLQVGECHSQDDFLIESITLHGFFWRKPWFGMHTIAVSESSKWATDDPGFWLLDWNKILPEIIKFFSAFPWTELADSEYSLKTYVMFLYINSKLLNTIFCMYLDNESVLLIWGWLHIYLISDEQKCHTFLGLCYCTWKTALIWSVLLLTYKLSAKTLRWGRGNPKRLIKIQFPTAK